MDPAVNLTVLKFALVVAFVMALRRRHAVGLLVCLSTLVGTGTRDLLASDGLVDWERRLAVARSAVERWEVLMEAGQWHYRHDDDEAAIVYFQRALDFAETHFDPGDLRVVDTLLHISELEDDPQRARQHLARALSIQEHALGTDHPDLAPTLEALVWTYDYRGDDFAAVVSLLERAVQLRRNGQFRTGLAESLRVLAWLYQSRGQPEAAQPYYEEALALDEDLLGTDDIRTVLAMESLALYYLEIARYDKAMELLRRKREVHLQVGDGRDYYNLSRTESALGWLWLREGDVGLAEDNFLYALEHLTQAVGPGDSTLHVPVLLDLVYLYAIQDRYEQAMPYFRRAQQILLAVGGSPPEDPAGVAEDHLGEMGAGVPRWPSDAHAQAIRLVLSHLGVLDDDG